MPSGSTKFGVIARRATVRRRFSRTLSFPAALHARPTPAKSAPSRKGCFSVRLTALISPCEYTRQHSDDTLRQYSCPAPDCLASYITPRAHSSSVSAHHRAVFVPLYRKVRRRRSSSPKVHASLGLLGSDFSSNSSLVGVLSAPTAER